MCTVKQRFEEKSRVERAAWGRGQMRVGEHGCHWFLRELGLRKPVVISTFPALVEMSEVAHSVVCVYLLLCCLRDKLSV